MRRSPWLCLLVVALATASAHAAAVSPPGVNLRWDQCYGDGGVWNKTFACDTNSGSERLVCSFELSQPLADVSGVAITIDVATESPLLPAWWQFKNAGTCRQTSLTSFLAPLPGSVNCVDWSNGAAAGGLAAYNIGLSGPNTARILAGFAVAADALADLDPGQEYLALNAVINHAKTVGSGACSGCTVPACLFLQQIWLSTPPVAGQPSRDVFLTRGANYSGSQFATWQNGYLTNIQRSCRMGAPGVEICNSTFNCVLATPTNSRGSTWGQVKTLYR